MSKLKLLEDFFRKGEMTEFLSPDNARDPIKCLVLKQTISDCFVDQLLKPNKPSFDFLLEYSDP